MTKGLVLLLLAFCPLAGATTYTVSPAQRTPAIQAVIYRASPGDTVAFSAGTYKIARRLFLKCGVTYTGPVAAPATAILSSSFGEQSSIFYLYSNKDLTNPCTQPTTIEYLSFMNSGGIYVQTSFTKLNILYNQFGNLPCCNGGAADQAIFFEGGATTSNTASMLTNATISHNTFGDSTSCTSPMNAMTNIDSPEKYQGACNGIVFFTSIDGLTVTYNNFYHVAEGVHINCPNYASQQYECEPPGGAITRNITVEYNDFSNIHRITWEEQPQQTGGIVFEYNSAHDWFMPYFGSFGLSMACCYNGTLAHPNLNGSSNVIIFNTVPGRANEKGSLRYGYGMEAMGNRAIYSNELVETANYSPCTDGCGAPAPGITFGRGPVANMNYNTVCGKAFAQPGSGYIVSEGLGELNDTPTLVGNVTRPTCQVVSSVAPSISPASGPASFPLTITLTDPGYTSGPQPLHNTGIWYTTDGSTPVPGSGTARYLPSGGTFVLPAAATVKAVGMWGAANQPTSYPAGYGFVASAVKSASYTGGVGNQPPRPR
jgi:hypothetical protein